jgi:hypothetical protein
MSVEGVGILAGLFGLPFIIAAAVLAILAKIFVVTAAGTVVTAASLITGAGKAAVALAQTGYRIYQENQEANAQENTQIADNFTSVRASVQSRRVVEQRRKNPQSRQEFTQQDSAALSKQLALETAQVETELRKRKQPEWKVPVLPVSNRFDVDLSGKTDIQPRFDVQVLRFDFVKTFQVYHDILRQLQQQMYAVAPNHEWTSEINELLAEADAKKVTMASVDAEYVHDFVEQTVQIHTKCARFLQESEKRLQRRAQVVDRAKEVQRRITQAQAGGLAISQRLNMYMSEFQQSLADGNLVQAERLLGLIDKELKEDVQTHVTSQHQHLTVFFADMLKDMEIFGDMVLIETSATGHEDERRRKDCKAWIRDYHAFMERVAAGDVVGIEQERDLLEQKANYLRDQSIDMSEEVQHGSVAGLFRAALNKLNYPDPDNDSGPVEIYAPIIGGRDGRIVSFQLNKDGTFTFTSEGFGDAECKVVYDQVLSLLQEWGVNFAQSYQWTQARAANAIISALQKVTNAVQVTERNGHIHIEATSANGPIKHVVDRDGRTNQIQGNVIAPRPRQLKSRRQLGSAAPEQLRQREQE